MAACTLVPTLVVDDANPSASALVKLPTCEEQALDATRVEDNTVLRLIAANLSIQAVESYPSVESLFLPDNAITSFTATAALRELDLTNNRLIRLANINLPSTLRRLFLDFNQLESFSAADFPPSLSDLYFRKSDLASLAAFSFPSNLNLLDISGNNRLRSLNGLVLPSKLSTFECSNCGVSVIEGVVFPPTLTTLKISGKTITSFTVRVSDVPQLQRASLQLDVSTIDVCDDAMATLTSIQPRVNACVLSDADFAAKYPAIAVPRTTNYPSPTSASSISSTNSPTATAIQSADSVASYTAIVVVAGLVLVAVVVGAIIAFAFQRRRCTTSHRGAVADHAAFKSGATIILSNTVFPSHASGHQSHSNNSSGFLDNDVRNDPLLIPYRLPRDELVVIDEIAEGGFGVVYHAKLHSEDVVIKQISPAARANISDILCRFMDEIRLYASLDHPKIVRFIGLSWTNLLDLGLVMEYMARGDLHSLLLKNQQLEWHDHTKCKALIALDVVEALVYLHSFTSPIVHRDLKAKNVLLSASYTAKLCDFGVSREANEDETMTGGVGTTAWIAPEVLQGERYSEKADIYSFGILLCEMDVAGHPYRRNRQSEEALTDAKIAFLVSTAALTPQLTEACPRAIQRVIAQCLVQDPAKRPTAAQLHYTLRKAHEAVMNKFAGSFV